MITNQLGYLEQELALQTHALDCFINETEIRIAGKKLKNNISFLSNKMNNEIIKSAVNGLMPVLFNTVHKSGYMSQTWCNGIITPIFKSGAESDPSDYRGIRISSCLGKLFNSQPKTS